MITCRSGLILMIFLTTSSTNYQQKIIRKWQTRAVPRSHPTKILNLCLKTVLTPQKRRDSLKNDMVLALPLLINSVIPKVSKFPRRFLFSTRPSSTRTTTATFTTCDRTSGRVRTCNLRWVKSLNLKTWRLFISGGLIFYTRKAMMARLWSSGTKWHES